MPFTQRTVQICLFLLAAIGLFGGVLQLLSHAALGRIALSLSPIWRRRCISS